METPRLYFISGLPRAGSTLLAAILRQNPRIHAAFSTALYQVFNSVRLNLSASNEFALSVTDAQREQVLRAVIEGFYAHSSASIIFDTSRRWTSVLPAIVKLLPNTKVICCLRNVAWILDSFERQVQSNGLRVSRMFTSGNPMGGNEIPDTAAERAAFLMKHQVGSSFEALRQAWFGEYAGRLIGIRYESLANDPANTIASLYELLGESGFDHDFERLDYSEHVFDDLLGMPDLHTVRARVEFKERQTILPPSVFAQHNRSFWDMPGQNPRGVPVLWGSSSRRRHDLPGPSASSRAPRKSATQLQRRLRVRKSWPRLHRRIAAQTHPSV
jgi:sulfotransferase